MVLFSTWLAQSGTLKKTVGLTIQSGKQACLSSMQHNDEHTSVVLSVQESYVIELPFIQLCNTSQVPALTRSYYPYVTGQ